MKNKIILSFFLLACLIFLNSFVSAAYPQIKMAVKECYWSYNDPDFGVWNGASQSGVFVKVENSNQNLGTTQFANYNFTNYQATLPGSTIPILKIESGKSNILYIKCNYNVGDYRIFFLSYEFPYGGDGYGLHFSTDFGLNKGIGIESGRIVNMPAPSYNGVANSYNNFNYNLKRPSTKIHYADNEVNFGNETDTGVKRASTIVNTEGFYPNTEPTVISKVNLSDFASGILTGYSLVRESGRIPLISYMDIRIYLNSTTKNLQDALVPIIHTGDGRITNLNYTNYAGQNTINTIECTEAAGNCFNMSKGGTFNITFYFRNPYGVALDSFNISNRPTPDDLGYARSGTYGDLGGRLKINITNGSLASIPPYSLANYSYVIEVPSNNPFIWPYYWGHIYVLNNNNPSEASQVTYYRPGGDDDKYLRFSNYDPRIETRLVGGVYTPVFLLNANVVTESYVHKYEYEVIYPGDYNLSFEIWNGSLTSSSSAMKAAYNVSLNSNFFSSQGITNMTFGSGANYSYAIPIKPEYLVESAGGTKYVIYAYTIANQGRLIGKKIATPMVPPYFTPGDIAYPLGNPLCFGGTNKSSGKLLIFNPSFKSAILNLSVNNWSDSQNFTLSWNGVSFDKYPSILVSLAPLESREITFLVNSSNTLWASNLKTVNIKASTNLNLSGVITYKEINLSYDLNLTCTYGSQTRWENLKNQPITKAQKGDYVKMIITNTGLGDGTVVPFEIYEKDFGSNDSIRTGANAISGIVRGGNAVAYWKITSEDLVKTSDFENFFFKVLANVSGDLNISLIEDDDPTEFKIFSPACGSNYTLGNILRVEVLAEDADDNLSGNLIFEAEGIFNKVFSNGGVIFNEPLNSAGNSQVVVTVSNTRGKMMRKISSIMVVDETKEGSYIAACIDKPADFSDAGSGDVLFLSNSSRGLRYTVVGKYVEVLKSQMNFFWSFSDGRNNPNTDGADSRSYDFHKTFIEAGHNWATLEVGYK